MCSHEEFFGPRELFYRPYHSIAVREVYHCTDRGFERWGVHIGRHGDDDLHIIRNGSTLELRLGLDHVLDAGV